MWVRNTTINKENNSFTQYCNLTYKEALKCYNQGIPGDFETNIGEHCNLVNFGYNVDLFKLDDNQKKTVAKYLDSRKRMGKDICFLKSPMGSGKTYMLLAIACSFPENVQTTICVHTLAQKDQYIKVFENSFTDKPTKVLEYVNKPNLCRECKEIEEEDYDVMKHIYDMTNTYTFFTMNPEKTNITRINADELIHLIKTENTYKCFCNLIGSKHRWFCTKEEMEKIINSAKISLFNTPGKVAKHVEVAGLCNSLSRSIINKQFDDKYRLCPCFIYKCITQIVNVIIHTYYGCLPIWKNDKKERYCFIDEAQNIYQYLLDAEGTPYHVPVLLANIDSDNRIYLRNNVFSKLKDYVVFTQNQETIILNSVLDMFNTINASSIRPKTILFKQIIKMSSKKLWTMFNNFKSKNFENFGRIVFGESANENRKAFLFSKMFALLFAGFSVIFHYWEEAMIYPKLIMKLKQIGNNFYYYYSTFRPTDVIAPLLYFKRVILTSGTIPIYLETIINHMSATSPLHPRMSIIQGTPRAGSPIFHVVLREGNVFFQRRSYMNIAASVNDSRLFDKLCVWINSMLNTFDEGILIVFICSINVLNDIKLPLMKHFKNNQCTFFYIGGSIVNADAFTNVEQEKPSRNPIDTIRNLSMHNNKLVVVTYTRSSIGEGYDNEKVRGVLTFLYPVMTRDPDAYPECVIKHLSKNDVVSSMLMRSYEREKDAHILFQCCGRAFRSSTNKSIAVILTNDEMVLMHSSDSIDIDYGYERSDIKLNNY